jgi:hypothetical protein
MFKSIKRGWNQAPAYVPPTLEEMDKPTAFVCAAIRIKRAPAVECDIATDQQMEDAGFFS